MSEAVRAGPRIKTTLPKAKELRGYAQPLITLAKNDSVANRRLASGPATPPPPSFIAEKSTLPGYFVDAWLKWE